MKRIALIAVAALIALAVAASPASAIQSVQKFSAKVKPSKAGTKKKPQAVSLSANPYFDTNAPDLDQRGPVRDGERERVLPQGRRLQREVLPVVRAVDRVPGREAVPARARCVGTAKGFGKGLGLDEDVVGKFFNSPAARARRCSSPVRAR